MMNKTSIKYLYKHTKRPKNGFPASVLDKITEECSQFHKISFDKDKMTIALQEGAAVCMVKNHPMVPSRLQVLPLDGTGKNGILASFIDFFPSKKRFHKHFKRVEC